MYWMCLSRNPRFSYPLFINQWCGSCRPFKIWMLLFKLVCFYESSIALMALDYLWVKLIFDMVNCVLDEFGYLRVNSNDNSTTIFDITKISKHDMSQANPHHKTSQSAMQIVSLPPNDSGNLFITLQGHGWVGKTSIYLTAILRLLVVMSVSFAFASLGCLQHYCLKWSTGWGIWFDSIDVYGADPYDRHVFVTIILNLWSYNSLADKKNIGLSASTGLNFVQPFSLWLMFTHKYRYVWDAVTNEYKLTLPGNEKDDDQSTICQYYPGDEKWEYYVVIHFGEKMDLISLNTKEVSASYVTFCHWNLLRTIWWLGRG